MILYASKSKKIQNLFSQMFMLVWYKNQLLGPAQRSLRLIIYKKRKLLLKKRRLHNLNKWLKTKI